MPIAINTDNAKAARRKPDGFSGEAHAPPLDPLANSETATTWRMEVFHTKL
jgi:hypothetical protein